jgi:hypothetical protein
MMLLPMQENGLKEQIINVVLIQVVLQPHIGEVKFVDILHKEEIVQTLSVNA